MTVKEIALKRIHEGVVHKSIIELYIKVYSSIDYLERTNENESNRDYIEQLMILLSELNEIDHFIPAVNRQYLKKFNLIIKELQGTQGLSIRNQFLSAGISIGSAIGGALGVILYIYFDQIIYVFLGMALFAFFGYYLGKRKDTESSLKGTQIY